MDNEQGPSKLESGEWTGDYVDVRGVRGIVRLTLKASGDDIEGDVEITLRLRDAPSVQKGRIRGQLKGSDVTFETVALSDPKAGDGKPVVFKGTLTAGGAYSKQAMFGTVGGVGERGEPRGVWIAWTYANANQAR